MGALIAGRYDIVRELGRGGMGEVLLARQVNLGRLVVIKRVLPEHATRFVKNLLEEARIAARLHHPCIVSVLDVSRNDEEPFVAMEYVAGVTLRDMLHRAPEGLPVEVALRVALDILRGLDYAHGVRSGESVGIVHRDIKPRNLMVTFTGDAKIIDFGISRWLAGDGAWESTSVSGTQGYMAPEQQHGRRVDARADQYAVAITLREMITGVSPRETEATVDDHGPARPPRRVLELELAAIVDRASSVDPELRYPDCASFAAALDAYAHSARLTPSTMEVERWMRAKLGDKIDLWESDAQRASEPSLPQMLNPTMRTEKPLRDPTASTSIHQTPPPTRRANPPSPLLRRMPWIAGGLAVILAGIVALKLSTGGATTHHPDLIAVHVTNSGVADDAWLAPAVEHIARRTLRDAVDRTYALAAINDPRPTRALDIAYRHTSDGIQLEAQLAGDAEPLARASGRSVAEAMAQLGPVVTRSLDERLPAVGADPEETAAMARLGARSVTQYRRFRASGETARLAGWIDSSEVAKEYYALLDEDVAWAHPYADLFWLRGGGTSTDGTFVLEAARTKIDASRDRTGATLLAALEAEAHGDYVEVIKIAEPLFKEDNTDLMVGETLQNALNNTHRGDEARAVFRRLHELYPHLYFAADIATTLVQEGREDQAERIVKDALAAYPDNLTAAREVVRFAAQRGDLATARTVAHRALLVHGEASIALSELFEIMVLSDDLSEAQRIVDRMLLGTPLSRARGRYRSAVLAIFEGRIGAAQLLGTQAAEEYGPNVGEESELPQCLTLLRSIGDSATSGSATARLAAWLSGVGDTQAAAVYLYRGALAAGGGSCPTIDTFTTELDEVDREESRRDILRSAAIAGCASCKDALARGFSSAELGTESLVALGTCAVKEHDLVTARRAFDEATRLWSSWWTSEASPYHAVLAHYHLATVLEALGDAAAARAEYERFLRYWGKTDRPIPEVAEARIGLTRLGTTPAR